MRDGALAVRAGEQCSIGLPACTESSLRMALWQRHGSVSKPSLLSLEIVSDEGWPFADFLIRIRSMQSDLVILGEYDPIEILNEDDERTFHTYPVSTVHCSHHHGVRACKLRNVFEGERKAPCL